MATVDFTLNDVQKLILEDRKHTEKHLRDSLLEERKYTGELIRSSALEERKHTRRAIDESGRKLIQNERELTRAMIRQELSSETGSLTGKLTSLCLAVGQNSKDIAEIKAMLSSPA